MHDLHFFLVILRSEKEKDCFLSFLKTPIPHFLLASHKARRLEKGIYKHFKIKL